MKKLDERSHWENEWADAFSNAKQPPSERVWHNIDSVLANKEARKYKKRAVFYKWLAAASVFVSTCGALLFILSNSQDTSGNGLATGNEAPGNTVITRPSSGQGGHLAEGSGNLPAEEPKEISLPEDGQLAINQKKSRETVSSANSSGTNAGSALKNEKAGSGRFVTAPEPEQEKVGGSEFSGTEETGSAHSAIALQEKEQEEIPYSLSTASVSEEKAKLAGTSGAKNLSSGLAFLELEKQKPAEWNPEEETIDFEVRKVWMPSDLFRNKEEDEKPGFWLGASLATNSFNPNFQDNSPNQLAMGQVSSNFKPQQTSRISAARIDRWDESQESVISFTGGVQGAAWLSEKWVLQAGLQYGTYKSSANAGAFIDPSSSNAYPLHYSNFSLDKINGVTAVADIPGAGASMVENGSIPVINTFEFFSVPLSIGYVVFDEKVGLMLSPGISSEFFLGNQLTDEHNLLNDYSLKAGEVPYQTVHFRGLVGAQVFYRLGEHYVISIEPTYQHAITDFNKSGSSFNSRPSNISVGAGFRYIFR